MPDTTTLPTPQQLEQFERDGFVVARQMFAPYEIAEIRDAFMTQNVDGPVSGLSEMGRQGKNYDPADPLSFYPRMMNPHEHPELEVGPVALRFMLDERLYPFLRVFVEDEPVAVQSMFYFKPPKARGQELHQDNYYLKVKPGTCMAAWVAIDDVDAENGGMRVVPGSQHMDIACPEKADLTISFSGDYVRVPEGLEAVHCDMKAGDVLFFNGSLIHGSTPNTSESRFRRSLIFHYVPQQSEAMSGGYRSRLTFAGNQITSIADTTDGGPCGVLQALPLH